MVESLRHPHNTADLLDLYLQYCQSPQGSAGSASNARMMIARGLVPALGGKMSDGLRTSPQEFKASMDFLRGIPIADLINAPAALEVFMEQENFAKKKRSDLRYHLSKFFQWTSQEKWLDLSESKQESESERPYFFRYGKERITHERQRNKPEKYAVDESDLSLDSQKELKDFYQFLIDRLRLDSKPRSTADNYMGHVRRILGWLQKIKGHGISELSLNLIVPLIETPKREKFASREDYLDALERVDERARDNAKQTKEIAKTFCEFYSENPNSRSDAVKVFIAVAKYQYRNETDEEEVNDFSDIRVVKRLGKLLSKYDADVQQKSNNPSIQDLFNKQKYLLPWSKVLYVLERLMEIAEQKVTYYPDERHKSGFSKMKRTESAIGHSLQNFLICAFLILLPPDRGQILYDMVISENLVRGKLDENQQIIIYKDWKHAPEDSTWYLFSNDFKTSGYQKAYFGRIPNFKLGKRTLYDYIDDWLNKYRPVILNGTSRTKLTKQPEYMFIGVRTKRKIDSVTICRVVKSAFKEFAGVSMTPHKLRHCFRTHLEATNAPPEIKKAAAIAMKHTETTAEKHYNRLFEANKVEPIMKYNEEIAENYFCINS
jgi:integrase